MATSLTPRDPRLRVCRTCGDLLPAPTRSTWLTCPTCLHRTEHTWGQAEWIRLASFKTDLAIANLLIFNKKVAVVSMIWLTVQTVVMHYHLTTGCCTDQSPSELLIVLSVSPLIAVIHHWKPYVAHFLIGFLFGLAIGFFISYLIGMANERLRRPSNEESWASSDTLMRYDRFKNG